MDKLFRYNHSREDYLKYNSVFMFKNIILEPEQEDLLIKIVEAARNVPHDKRQKFFIVQTNVENYLDHPGLPGGEIQIYFGDVEILAREGLLALEQSLGGSPNFDVMPLGLRYYEYLKTRLGKPIERVEKTIHDYLGSHDFQKKYPKAFGKWSAAEELLWKADTKQQATTIGHLCRESVQEFADTLIEKYNPINAPEDKSKTVKRLEAVIDHRQKELGSSKESFLKALVEYWKEVNNLIQRQEHDSQKEGTELKWEDARRVVFQTIVVMFEIDRALEIK